MDTGFSKYFLSNMGLKDGCPLTPTHFNICIDKHDKIVNKVAKEEWLDSLKLMHKLIFILLYDDDVLFSYNLDDMQHLLDVLNTFDQINELTMNVDKTKMMAMQPRYYPTFTYKVEPKQVDMQS